MSDLVLPEGFPDIAALLNYSFNDLSNAVIINGKPHLTTKYKDYTLHGYYKPLKNTYRIDSGLLYNDLWICYIANDKKVIGIMKNKENPLVTKYLIYMDLSTALNTWIISTAINSYKIINYKKGKMVLYLSPTKLWLTSSKDVVIKLNKFIENNMSINTLQLDETMPIHIDIVREMFQVLCNHNLLELYNEPEESKETITGMCVACQDAKSIYTFSCGHLTYCEECYAKSTKNKCPICRTISNGIKLIIP